MRLGAECCCSIILMWGHMCLHHTMHLFASDERLNAPDFSMLVTSLSMSAECLTQQLGSTPPTDQTSGQAKVLCMLVVSHAASVQHRTGPDQALQLPLQMFAQATCCKARGSMKHVPLLTYHCLHICSLDSARRPCLHVWQVHQQHAVVTSVSGPTHSLQPACCNTCITAASCGKPPTPHAMSTAIVICSSILS